MNRSRFILFIVVPLLLGQECTSPAVVDDGTGWPTLPPSPRVTMMTNRGPIVIELFTQQSTAAANFKRYVEEGYYNDTLFHETRSNTWILGGAYTAELSPKEAKSLVNESANGFRHLRGRVALYGPAGVGSGVPQFRINLVDNITFDDEDQPVEYTVIGTVVEGMAIADEIGDLPITTRTASNSTSLARLPVPPVSVNDPDFSGSYPGEDPSEEYVTTESGLKYRDVILGTGELIQDDSTVKVLYEFRLNDKNGEVVYSRLDPNNPAELALDAVIEGWQEGLSQYDMRVGGKRILIVPPDLGYGEEGYGLVPPNATLYYEVEILELVAPSESDESDSGTDGAS